jgi:sodium-dependent dicarboxylate transporter 2/3/5
MAGHLNFLKGAPIAVIILAVCVVVCIISEFASNVASIQLVLPVLLAVSKSIDVNPLLLMLPATLAASLGYMLPVATAANTIVFGTKMVPLKSMLRSGFWVDLAGIVLICLGGLFLVQMLLGA